MPGNCEFLPFTPTLTLPHQGGGKEQVGSPHQGGGKRCGALPIEGEGKIGAEGDPPLTSPPLAGGD